MNNPFHSLDSGWVSVWLAGIPLIGGLLVTLFNMVRRRERTAALTAKREMEAAARDREIRDRLDAHDAAITEITIGQRQMRDSINHQTEVLSTRLDGVINAVLARGSR